MGAGGERGVRPAAVGDRRCIGGAPGGRWFGRARAVVYRQLGCGGRGGGRGAERVVRGGRPSADDRHRAARAAAPGGRGIRRRTDFLPPGECHRGEDPAHEAIRRRGPKSTPSWPRLRWSGGRCRWPRSRRPSTTGWTATTRMRCAGWRSARGVVIDAVSPTQVRSHFRTKLWSLIGPRAPTRSPTRFGTSGAFSRTC